MQDTGWVWMRDDTMSMVLSCSLSTISAEYLHAAVNYSLKPSQTILYRRTGPLLHCHADRYVLSRIVLFDLVVRRLLQRHRIGNI